MNASCDGRGRAKRKVVQRLKVRGEVARVAWQDLHPHDWVAHLVPQLVELHLVPAESQSLRDHVHAVDRARGLTDQSP